MAIVEVSAAVDMPSSGSFLTSVSVTVEAQGKSTIFSMSPGSKYSIPVIPGKIRVQATFGPITTDKKEFEIEAGEVKAVIFRFGKGS